MPPSDTNKALAFLGAKLDNIANTLQDFKSGFSGNLNDISKSFFLLKNEMKEVVKSINSDSEFSNDARQNLISRVIDLQDFFASIETRTYETELKDIYSCLEDIKTCLEDYFSREVVEKEDMMPEMCEKIDAITDILSKQKPVELKTVEKGLKDVEKAIKSVEIPETEVDFTPTNKILQDIKKNIPDTKDVEKYLAFMYTNLYGCLEEVKQYSKGILNELKKEKEFKLNDNQFRQLRNAGTVVTGGSIGGAMPQANRVRIVNVAMALANTQYTHTFGAGTVSWELRMRDTDVPLLVAYTTGKLPTSGDGSAYFTVPAYFIQHINGVDWSNKILYIQTASVSQVLEVIEYHG